MRHKCMSTAGCPVARTLDLVGEWWTLLILRDALAGVSRFGEFQASLGMAKNILAQRLRKLVDNGILELRPAADGSAYREYGLTEKGRSLGAIVGALRDWGERHLPEPGAGSAQSPRRSAARTGAPSRPSSPRPSSSRPATRRRTH